MTQSSHRRNLAKRPEKQTPTRLAYMTNTAAPAGLRQVWSFTGRYRVLHLTWFAFFLTFVVWFNLPPLAGAVAADLGLTKAQLATLALCNVALTVPARIVIGVALDRFGPRRVFAGMLMYAAVPCLICATATSFGSMVVGRLGASIVGAGFVVGVRMVAEWFPKSEMGTAEGIYGGWGNFGAAGAALALPAAAWAFGGAEGWRWAMASSGLIAAAYGVVYLRTVEDTPDGRVYLKPKRAGALMVSSRRAVAGLAVWTAPLAAGLLLVSWRLSKAHLLRGYGLVAVVAVIAVLTVWQLLLIRRVNRSVLHVVAPVEGRYAFRSVPILSLCYFATFGSEVAVVSMLPLYVAGRFHLAPVAAGLLAGLYPFMNLTSRPAGGIASDRVGSRRNALLVLLVALACGYGVLLLSLRSHWPLPAVAVVLVVAAILVEAGAGATFAVVPLINARSTGQISGIVGAYGNLGSLCYLTILALWGPMWFFGSMAAVAVLAAGVCLALPDLADHESAVVALPHPRSVGQPQREGVSA
ncbi:MAG: NarK family nitrate/nitrite MFS transporter [Actinomycetota bacterium]